MGGTAPTVHIGMFASALSTEKSDGSLVVSDHVTLYPVEFSAVRTIVSPALNPTKVIVGGVVSVWLYSKVTVKFAVPIFPAASDAVQITVVIPTGKNKPDVGVHVGVTGWEYIPVEFVTASVAVGRL